MDLLGQRYYIDDEGRKIYYDDDDFVNDEFIESVDPIEPELPGKNEIKYIVNKNGRKVDIEQEKKGKFVVNELGKVVWVKSEYDSEEKILLNENQSKGVAGERRKKRTRKKGPQQKRQSIKGRRRTYQYEPKINENTVLDYDIQIIIASKDRYDTLTKIIEDIFSQKTDYSFKMTILDDASEDKRYLTLMDKYNDVLVIRNPEVNGKKKYWKTINNLFFETKKSISRCVLQMDDDFVVCDDFLNRLMGEYFKAKSENEKCCCVAYHLTQDHNKRRWGLAHWVDGGGLYDYNFLDRLGFRIQEISPTRFKYKKTNSSGVWYQISHKIKRLGHTVYKPNESLVDHVGHEDSKMHPALRKKRQIKTINFNGKSNISGS
jgi:hypothetical protein